MDQKIVSLVLCSLAIFGLALASSNVSSHAYALDTSELDAFPFQILDADERHVVVELELPAYEIENVVHGGVEYQRLRVPEWPLWRQAGKPMLPIFSAPLGMPALGVPEITVVESESDVVRGVWLYPAPALDLSETGDEPRVVEVFSFDPEAYSADAFYPGPLADATSAGFLRDQALFQLRLYPFQYNPVRRELRVYRRLRIHVAFPEYAPSPGEARDVEPSPVFEHMLEKTLLNYDSLPPSPGAPAPPRDAVSLAVLDDQPQVKLIVEESGLYRVTYDDVLAVAPALAQCDPRHLQLSNRGVDIPIQFEGQADGVFGPGDSFVFYGQAIDSLYTSQNVYWLRDVGTLGLRMAQRDGTPGAGTTPASFPDKRYFESNRIYHLKPVPEGEGMDHWLWDELVVNSATPDSVDYTFFLDHIADGGPDGELRLMLMGGTSGDHVTQLYLNGVALLSQNETVWSGQIAKLYEISVAQDMFIEGDNHLRVEGALPAGEPLSRFYVNWFEVAYHDTFVAEEDRLEFLAPSTGFLTLELTGFSTDAVEVFDVTDPAAPQCMVNPSIEPDGGDFRVRFSDGATAGFRYLAQRTDQLPTPALLLDEPSAWKSPANGATYIILTYPGFYDAVQPLATHRSNQGETVVVVKSQDVYDEFYHGIYDPQAIRSFLEYAYHNWSPRPVYVLLVGDSSMDPKNNRGSSLSDLLPTYFLDDPVLGETPNDAWYAKVHGDDDYPDLIVGRISARWSSDLDTAVGKIRNYESSWYLGSWMRRAVLVADDDEPIFAQDMDMVADLLPPSLTPIKLYDYSYATSVEREVNRGALLLAYSGHGYITNWGGWGSHEILSMSDLRNGKKLPFVTAATCFNGYFASYEYARSIGERFVLFYNKGGIASWTPASYGYPSSNTVIMEELYDALIVDGDLTLGSAATTARLEAHLRRPDVPLSYFEVFTYLGDPAVRLPLPATLELGGQDIPDPVTMGESLSYTLSYTVSDADQARGLKLVNTLPEGVLYQSASTPPSSVYAQSLTWNLGDVPAGSYTITIDAVVATSGLAHGQIVQDQARLYDATGGDHIIQIETTVRDVSIAGLWASNDSPTELGEITTLSAGVASGTNVIYTWDFGDGSPSQTGATVQHSYPAVGTYVAQVTAANGMNSRSVTTPVTIVDVPPVASFISSSPDVIGQTTTFQSTSTGTNLTYRWNFGDGSPTAEGQTTTVTHTYAYTGTYTAALTITNSAGSSTASKTIDILSHPNPPVASFSSSSPDELGQTTVFINTSQDGGDDEENVSYAWHFGDETSSTAPHPTHIYDAVGSYVVSLTVTNSFASDTFSDTVLITDVPIGGLAVENDSPTALGSATTLSATTASGTNVSYLWALGDGTSGVGPAVTHVYGAVGSYTVVVTATNGRGSDMVTDTVTIVDEPIGGLSILYSDPTYLGSSTAFTAVITAGTNLSFLWDFGDGVTSSLRNPEHTYGAVGDYAVVLTATNGWGSQVWGDTISVGDVPLGGLNIRHNGSIMLGEPAVFTATVTAGTNVIYNWHMGDGNTEVGAYLVHTYADPGTYSVTVTAINSTSESETSAYFTVMDPDLSIFLPTVLKSQSP